MAIATAGITNSLSELLCLPEPCSLPVLRIGVILSSLDLPLWVRRILQHLERSTCLRLAAVLWIQETSQRTQRPAGPFKVSAGLFKAWSWFDYRFYRHHSARPDALECAPVDFRRSSTPQWVLVGTDMEVTACPSDMEGIKAANLDIILHFGSCTLSPDMGRWAKHGVWSLGTPNDWASCLLRYMNRGGNLLETKMSVHRYPDKACTLTCSHSAMDLISVFRNHNTFCWKTAEAITYYLQRLHQHGWEFCNDKAANLSTAGTSPGTLETIGFLGRWLLRSLRAEIRKRLLREHWFIAYAPVDANNTIHYETKVTVLEPPSDRFYADPFAFDFGGRTYIFFEDFRFQRNKAVISYVEVDESGRCAQPELALERPYHLSYPCIFEWQGHVYLVPETKDNGTIEVYRAADFPRQWQLETVLVKDVLAVDATILCYGGKFWLFTAGFAPLNCYSSGSDELFLFFSDSPLGSWISHPKNPVVRDVRRSRPAGHLFLDGDRLIRPAQDSSRLYGGAVCFNRVDVLSETDYRETPIASIRPDWFPNNLGTHTFNQTSRLQVVDGRVLVSRFRPGRPGPPKTFQYAAPRGLFWSANGK